MSTPKQRLNYITTAAFIAAVYAGLTYLGNFFGLSYGPIDMIFGTFATFLAAVLTYLTRKIIFKKLPLFPLLFPVIINAFIIGLELAIFYLNGFTFLGFAIAAFEVGTGQLIACYGLGLPLYFTLKGKKFSKLNIFKAEE